MESLGYGRGISLKQKVMKAIELRIGNWIKDGYDYEQITIDHLIALAKGRCEFDSVPLTEQWLIDFGFEQCENQFWFEKSILSISTIGIINIKGRKGSEAVLNSGVKFVHQLQNLYFALTGEELNK